MIIRSKFALFFVSVFLHFYGLQESYGAETLTSSRSRTPRRFRKILQSRAASAAASKNFSIRGSGRRREAAAAAAPAVKVELSNERTYERRIKPSALTKPREIEENFAKILRKNLAIEGLGVRLVFSFFCFCHTRYHSDVPNPCLMYNGRDALSQGSAIFIQIAFRPKKVLNTLFSKPSGEENFFK